MRSICVYIALSIFILKASAQDLNARVTVLSPKIQTTNKRMFQSLETAMKDFLNGRKWLGDAVLPHERIECSFVVNITSWDGSSNFNAELQVQSIRPVFNSNYTTSLLNINDKDFDFTYTDGQTIDYSDQNFQSNLASVMAFYAYIIAGVDHDSFSRLGGTPFYARAQNVMTIAQSSSYRGWKAFDSNTNRYWLIENLNNKVYEPLRGFLYDYHRNGMDLMADNVSRARKAINGFLPVLAEVDRQRLGAMLPLVFFAAKSDELVNIYAAAPPQERVQAFNILIKADPSNGIKYQALQK
jgi:hypothetical protein